MYYMRDKIKSRSRKDIKRIKRKISETKGMTKDIISNYHGKTNSSVMDQNVALKSNLLNIDFNSFGLTIQKFILHPQKIIANIPTVPVESGFAAITVIGGVMALRAAHKKILSRKSIKGKNRDGKPASKLP